jgi:plastocyanin
MHSACQPHRSASGRPEQLDDRRRRGSPPERLLATVALLAPLLCAVAAVAPAEPTPHPQVVTATLRVRVVINQAGKGVAASDAVVWVPGVAKTADRAPRRQMAQSNREFRPHVEAVSVGSTVDFPNHDRIYHNVFSLSEIARFDLGLYRNGASRSVTFTKPGVVRIYCNIHPHMAAYLVVVDSSCLGKTGAAGVVELADVPVGRHTVRVWHEQGGDGSAPVDVVEGRVNEVAVTLDASQWRPQPHKNKYGKDYPPPDDNENRY